MTPRGAEGTAAPAGKTSKQDFGQNKESKGLPIGNRFYADDIGEDAIPQPEDDERQYAYDCDYNQRNEETKLAGLIFHIFENGLWIKAEIRHADPGDVCANAEPHIVFGKARCSGSRP